MIPAFYLANRLGIPRIESVGVDISTTELTFSFRQHQYSSSPFKGLLIVHLSAVPVGVEPSLPVKFGSINLKGFNSANITVENLSGEGIYLVYYDSTKGLLQLVSGYAA